MESTFTEDQGMLIQEIQAAASTDAIKLIDGREVLVHNGKIITEALPRVRPELSRVDVESLASLADLVLTATEENLIIKVNSPSEVFVIDVKEAEQHQTVAVAVAAFPVASMLSQYVSLDQALTEIRECFEQGDVVEGLADTLRTTKIEDITELTDNGMGMDVSVKSRVTNGKKADSTAFNLELTPIRTFAEVETLPGTFTMRWKRDGEKISVRLIEQQSHRWRFAQMAVVKGHLESLLQEVTILM